MFSVKLSAGVSSDSHVLREANFWFYSEFTFQNFSVFNVITGMTGCCPANNDYVSEGAKNHSTSTD